MGCYDTFGNLSIQLKCTECLLNHFNVGDDVELSDGIYVGYEGCVVVFGGKFVAELPLECVYDKWGGTLEIDLDKRNPIASVCRELREELKKDN